MITTTATDEKGNKVLGDGMMKRQMSQHQNTNFIEVESLDENSSKVQQLGGKVVVPKMSVPGMGYLAYCLDTEKQFRYLGDQRKRKMSNQLMVSTRSSTPVIMLSVVVLILIYTTFPTLLPSYFVETQNSTTPKNIAYQGIPTTISEEAQEELRKITFNPTILNVPDPSDLNGWKKQYNNSESMFAELSQPIIDLYQPNITETKLGGVQVLDIKPRNWNDNGKVLVYTHGSIYIW